MKINTFVVNDFSVNTYILHDETGECAIIDPGFYTADEKTQLNHYIESNKLKPILLLNTHCHADHIFGNAFIVDTYQASLCAHSEEEFLMKGVVEFALIFGFHAQPSPTIDRYIEDGGLFTFGNTTLEAIHLPGHSPGGVAFYNREDKVLFSGDTLFKGSIGRTDLPGGDYQKLITSIKSRLSTLHPNTIVYPGHGETTTIGHEVDTNPFLQ